MDTKDIEKRKLIIEPIPSRTEEIGKIVLDSAFKVHSVLGPGLLESIYEACLIHELKLRSMRTESQVSLPIVYEGLKIDSGFRLDILVDKSVIVEVKAVDSLNPIFKAQLLTYLKLSNTRLGFLINFNVIHLRNGISRLVN